MVTMHFLGLGEHADFALQSLIAQFNFSIQPVLMKSIQAELMLIVVIISTRLT